MSLSTRGGEILIEDQKSQGILVAVWHLLTLEKIENPYKGKCCQVQSDSYKQIGERRCPLNFTVRRKMGESETLL